jgi:uncharacterized protein
MATVYYGERFEWDDEKARANLAKHGISFESASGAWEDFNAVDRPDEAHSIDEERRIMLGMSKAGTVVFISWTWRDGRRRLISARKASAKEREDYGTHNL